MKRKTKKFRKREKKTKLQNKKLVKKYPWLAPRDYWTGKIDKDYDYSWIKWGCSPGWDVAYGDMYLKELGTAVEKAGAKNSFCIDEIKEKYGEHRVYCSLPSDEIKDIIDKYETLSRNICIGCGKPDVPMLNDHGWYYPLCYECYRHQAYDFGRYVEEDIKEDELKQEYNSIAMDDSMMPDTFTRRMWTNKDSKVTEETIDISETANKIRIRWNKRCKKRLRRLSHEESSKKNDI